MAQNPLKVFISYSHKDRDGCEELKSHLQPFADKHLIVVWVDDRTLAGEEWEGPVSDNLNSAHLTILLLSPSFINSRYCKEIEMRRAFERAKNSETVVIPILYKTFKWEQYDEIRKCKILPLDGKAIVDWKESPDLVWKEVMDKVEEQIVKVNKSSLFSRQRSRSDGSLIPFLVDRNEQNDRLTEIIPNLTRTTDYHGKPVLIFATGVGKDCLGEYVKVLCHHNIPEMTAGSRKQKKPVEFERVPTGSDQKIGSQHNWWPLLCQKLIGRKSDHLNDRQLALSKLGSKLRSNFYVLWFQLQSSVLGDRPQQAIETCVSFVRELKVENAKYNLIAAVTIEYGDEPKKGLFSLLSTRKDCPAQVRKYLDTLCSGESDQDLLTIVLPEMKSVQRTVIPDWADLYKEHLSDKPTSAEITKIYQTREILTDDDGIRMEDLAAELKGYLRP